MTEVFFSNVAILQPLTLLRNWIPPGLLSLEFYKVFCNDYGLGKLLERFLLKESCDIQQFTIS